MSSKRRFRLRSKHYDYMMIGCILVGCVFVVSAFYKHKHKATVALQQQKSNQRMPASIPSVSQQTQNDLAGQPLTPAQQQLTVYFSHAREVLGDTQAGKLAYILFLRGMVPQAAKTNPKLATLCVSDKTCPVKLADLYKFAIGRFSASKDLLARVALQRDMLASQMSVDSKKQILTGLLLGADMHNAKPTSVASKQGKIQVGRDVEYTILTISQYESLKPKTDQLVGMVLKVAANSPDPLARKVILQGLNKAYPKFSKDINSQAARLGVKLAAR